MIFKTERKSVAADMSRYYGDGIVDVSFVEVGKLVFMSLKSGSLFSITFHSNAFTITVEQKNINK